MKLNFYFFLFFLSLCIISFSQSDIKEGEWEISIKMEIEGMNFEMPGTKVKQCIKKDNPYPINEEKGKKPDCKFLKQEVKGNTVSWEMECKEGKDVFYSKGWVTYKGNSFEGKTYIEIRGDEPQKMTQIMTGKYLGPCK